MTYKPFGFDYKEIIKNVDSLKSLQEKKNYLEWILLEAKNIINKVKYNQLIFVGIDSENKIPIYLGKQSKIFKMQNDIFEKMLKETYNHVYKSHKNHENITREKIKKHFNKLFFHFEKVTLKSLKIQLKKLKLELKNTKSLNIRESKIAKSKRIRTTDEEKIKSFISKAFELGETPKGNKYLSSTMYSKLTNINFLIKLSTAIKEKIDSKYNYSTEKQNLLNVLFVFCDNKIKLLKMKKDHSKKYQSKETEYNDELDYGNPHSKKSKSPEY